MVEAQRDEQEKGSAGHVPQLPQMLEALEQTIQKSQETESALQTLTAENDQRQADAGELRTPERKVEELGKENELLLLQLHQVQEELEHYFLKYKEVTQTGSHPEGDSTPTVREQPETPKAEETVIDMRHFIDGDNWHEAEDDGRWTGPGTTSNIRLPALAKGRYKLELEVVDAMAPEILRDMEVKLNGHALQLKGSLFDGISGPWAPIVRLLFRAYKGKYIVPIQLTGAFQVDEKDANSALPLQFSFPKTMSPATHGSRDTRELAARFKQLRILHQ